MITTGITEAGLRVVKQLDGSMLETRMRLLDHLGAGRLGSLSDLVELARSKVR